MKHEKKFREVLPGTVLTIGAPAYLLTDNPESGEEQLIKTSSVVDFFQHMDGSITVETKNTIYRCYGKAGC